MGKPIKEITTTATHNFNKSDEVIYYYTIDGYEMGGYVTIPKRKVGNIPPEKLIVAIRFRKWWQRLWFKDGWCGSKH